MKIDLKYLLLNLDLEKFVKLLNKTVKWTNEKDIYYKFIDCCQNKQMSKKNISSLIDRETVLKIDELMADGNFFRIISKNFKVIKSISRQSKMYGDMGYDYQLIKSNINNIFYVTVYQSYDYTNDSYFVTYKSK